VAKSIPPSKRTSLHAHAGPVNESARIRNIKKRSVERKSNSFSASSSIRFRKRHRLLWAVLPAALVLVAIAALVITKVTSSPKADSSASSVVFGNGSIAPSAGNTALPAGVLSAVTSVSASTLAAVGEPSSSAAPVPTGIATPLTASDGKPEVLFVSAEYCPYCAAQRWPLVMALSHFGSFRSLSATHSSTTDVYPDTRSFSFYGSTFTSSSLNFTSVELQTNQVSGTSYGTLQALSASQKGILSRLDGAPYTNEVGSIPFLDIANKYLIVGSGYSPQLLQGLTMRQISSQLNDVRSPVAVAIDGEANQIVKAITMATGIQPSRGAVTTTTMHP